MLNIYTTIGKKIRIFRELNGISQKGVADVLGITFQQVQKYEQGANRIPVDKLVTFCKEFNAPLLYIIDYEKSKHSFSFEELELIMLHRKGDIIGLLKSVVSSY